MKGSIKDKFQPSVCNVGYIGNVKQTTKNHNKKYRIWLKMIARCYEKSNLNYRSYGAKGVTVCDRWKCFEYFLQDISKIDGYEHDSFKNGKLQLDKDKKQLGFNPNEKVYSLETCCFLEFQENRLHADNSVNRKEFLAISPDGQQIVASGIEQFAKKHGLNRRLISACLNNKSDQHKGWKFKFIQEG